METTISLFWITFIVTSLKAMDDPALQMLISGEYLRDADYRAT
jgi:hypothetical protein